MKLIRLHVKNIRSYENQELIFPEGAVLLSGNVGSGKTTLLLAIEYALFGLQAGQKASSLLRNNADEGSVTLECEIDGNNVFIERGLKRDKRAIVSDYAILGINGNKGEYSITELKSKILQLLGYPSELLKKTNLLYKYTIYTPQEQMKQIVLEDFETRLSTIRTVFGVEKYRFIKENLSIVINNIKEEIKSLQIESKILEQEKGILQEKKQIVSMLEKRKEEAESSIAQKQKLRRIIEKESANIEGKIKEREHFEKEIEKTSILLNSKKESISLIDKELPDLKKTLSENPAFDTEEYRNLIARIADRKASIESVHSAYLALLSKIHSLEENKSIFLEKKQRIFSISFCPTCLQNVPDVHKHNILNETEARLSEIKKQVQELESNKKAVLVQLSGEKATLEDIEAKKSQMDILKSKSFYIERAKSRISELDKNKIALIGDLSLLEKHLLSLKEEVSSFSRFDAQAKKKLEELKQAFVEEKNAEILRAEINKEIELTLFEISKLNISIQEREAAKARLSNLLELNDWLSNQFLALISFIEIQVLMKLRAEFSKLFSSWFTMIVGDQFEIQLDENFTPLIIQKGVEMDYSFLSGGERTAVALAYRLALNQTINSVLSNIKTKDLIILDEPTDGFSEAQIDKIRDVLEQLKVQQLIIVSHEQKVESFVDKVIRIQKEGEVSKIMQ